MGYLKNELSGKNKYHLSKHRYLELKHFCLQYPEWKSRLREINNIYTSEIEKVRGGDVPRDPERIAIERLCLTSKIELVEKIAQKADVDIWKWLMLGVTEERPYPWLFSVAGIPCGKDMYYDRYRRFYWLLSQDLHRT